MLESLSAFWAEYGTLLLEGTRDTLIMVGLSTVFAYLIGLPLGVLLSITQPHGIWPHKWFNRVLGWIINVGRSLPFIILMIAITSPSPSPISIETTASSSVIGSFVSNSGMDENTSETSNNFPMIFVLSYTYFSTSTQVKPRFFFGFFGSSSFFSAWWAYTDRSASGFSL